MFVEADGTKTFKAPESSSTLLSRYPALSWQVLRLPRVPFRFPVYLREPGKVIVVDAEPRAVAISST